MQDFLYIHFSVFYRNFASYLQLMSSTKINIQETNNETILKFVSNKILVNGGSYEYNNIDEAKNSPLAQQLFYLPFVKKVLVTANFIAIQRYDIVEWDDVEEEVREQIEAYIQSGSSVVKEETTKKDAVEVYAEVTPNPAVMKFGTNKALTQTDVEFKNIEEASKSSPLAQALFSFPFVKEIFISENYISITKYDMIDWNEVYQEVRTFIRSYIQEGKKIITELPKQQTTQNVEVPKESLTDTETKIVDILDEYIKPAVASDGGNIAFQSYDAENKRVSVVLQGACSGCPSSTVTLKNGIETMLKEMLPNQINEVVAING
ncbi:Fe-S cluster biogenesis protein NfuA [Tenacibaculum gallaicum]|uniref:Fe-S cluster biogenesis protein NfuA n=2 Tax=Tenacibaculum gallaicum TaxID=561505 RepID=A0A3E0HJG1_9FLAO|nr:Fe-S cluster biogenesis protein NfuA [Tenacibaculum gallaicum]